MIARRSSMINTLDKPIVFCDVETTGSSAKYGKITEVACIRYENGAETDRFVTLLNPDRSIPYHIQNITGITNAMVANAPRFHEITDDLSNIFKDAIQCAHNARFDLSFLKSEFQNVGVEFKPDVLCTVQISRKLFSEYRSHSLSNIIKRYGFTCSARHRALGDTEILVDFANYIDKNCDNNSIISALSIKKTLGNTPPNLDPERAPVIKQMFEKIGYDGWSGRKLHIWLRDELDFKTENGKHLSLGNLYRILENHFYYGRFEYPKNSGKWYDGAHEPIITKELFTIVQEQIKSQILEPRSQQKEFAFTKVMTCGLCGSGITADEKFKKQKNGNVHRYVYYKCTRTKDPNCDCGFINENDLISQLQNLIDDVDIKVVPMRDKITVEVKRYKQFQQMLLVREEKIAVSNIDIRNYAKFILQEGDIEEKRDFLRCLKSQILLTKKIVKLGLPAT